MSVDVVLSSAAFLVICVAGASAQVLPNPSPTPPATTPASSPTPVTSPTPSLERRFLKNILRDQQAIWTSPLKVQSRDANWLAPLGLTTTILIATDSRTAGALNDDPERLQVSRAVSQFGALYTTGGIAAGFYFVGRARGDARARETGLLSLEALANSVIVYKALKVITQRPRPRMKGGRGRFFDGGDSFPSGHAANAWAVATVVAYEYRDRPWVRFGAYGVATAVSLSRYTGRNHFLSDVLVGSALGYGIGRYVYRKHHDPSLHPQSGPTKTSQSKLFPLVAPAYSRTTRGYGLTLVWSF